MEISRTLVDRTFELAISRSDDGVVNPEDMPGHFYNLAIRAREEVLGHFGSDGGVPKNLGFLMHVAGTACRQYALSAPVSLDEFSSLGSVVLLAARIFKERKGIEIYQSPAFRDLFLEAMLDLQRYNAGPNRADSP